MRFYKALSKVKALTFDLDDTLYNNAPRIAAAEAWFAAYLTERYALPQFTANPAFWAQLKEECAAAAPSLRDDVTLLRARALEYSFARLKCPLSSPSEAMELVQIFIRKRSEVPVPPASLQLLSYLKSRLPLAAVSNGNVQLEALGLQPYFVFDLRPSLQPGRRSKPCADLFYEAAARFGCAPSEILHVGDEPATDVNGALGAGCQCAWLKGGIAGLSPGSVALRQLPTLELDSLQELQLLFP